MPFRKIKKHPAVKRKRKTESESSPPLPVARNHSHSVKQKLQFLSVLEGAQAWSREVNGRLQAGDLLVIGGVDVGKDAVGSLLICVSTEMIADGLRGGLPEEWQRGDRRSW